MVLLVLSEIKMLPDILNEIKLMTTRYNNEYWFEILKTNKKLDIWWKYPGTLHPCCVKLGIAKATDVRKTLGKDIDEFYAKLDGFNSRESMVKCFMNKYNINENLFNEHECVSISWVWNQKFWKSKQTNINMWLK